MTRVGIELTASRCTLVDVSSVAGRRGAASARVRAFTSIPYAVEAPEPLAAELGGLLARKTVSRRAWVIVWGAPHAHVLLLLPPARPADLDALARREARRELSMLQGGGEAVLAVAPGATRSLPTGGMRREVMVAAAAAPDLTARVRPILDAGFDVEGMVTPSLALLSLARQRPGVIPGVAVAYLAVAPTAVALAVVRDGVLLFAREIPWGYHSERASDRGRVFDRQRFTEKLGSELRRSFLFVRQTLKTDVSQLAICGDMPELRSMTAPLIEALDLEVETLDSLEGLAQGSVPAEMVGEFRERVAELRPALALAADPSPPINLLPEPLRVRRAARRFQVTLGGGLAASLAAALLLYGPAERSARGEEQRVRDLRRRVAVLEPRADEVQRARRDQVLEAARRAALGAFDVQGPRIARALDGLAVAAPPEVALRTLKVQADGASWLVTIEGVASASDPGLAQVAVNSLLHAMARSPYLGVPIRPPSLRIATGGRRSGERAESGGLALPPGTSGIAFSVEIRVPK